MAGNVVQAVEPTEGAPARVDADSMVSNRVLDARMLMAMGKTPTYIMQIRLNCTAGWTWARLKVDVPYGVRRWPGRARAHRQVRSGGVVKIQDDDYKHVDPVEGDEDAERIKVGLLRKMSVQQQRGWFKTNCKCFLVAGYLVTSFDMTQMLRGRRTW